MVTSQTPAARLRHAAFASAPTNAKVVELYLGVFGIALPLKFANGARSSLFTAMQIAAIRMGRFSASKYAPRFKRCSRRSFQNVARSGIANPGLTCDICRV